MYTHMDKDFMKQVQMKMNISPAATTVFLIVLFAVTHGSLLKRHREESAGLGIIGGQPVDISEFPYQVAIESNDILVCGGSIITPKHIITAAHCFRSATENKTVIRAGSSVVLDEGVVVKVAEIIRHPKYDAEFSANDIAILVLEESLTYSKNIQPIEVPSQNSDYTGSVGTVSGYGKTESGRATHLMAVGIPIIPHEECTKIYANLDVLIGKMHLCAGTKEGGKDSCNGDSGGPLAVKGVQVGIVCGGNGCGLPNVPGVYTAIAFPEIREFIRDIAGV